MALEVRPVTPKQAPALEELFSSKGCPGYCWCTPYRFKDAQHMDKAEKKKAMLGLDGAPSRRGRRT